jgi:hypothetical protein
MPLEINTLQRPEIVTYFPMSNESNSCSPILPPQKKVREKEITHNINMRGKISPIPIHILIFLCPALMHLKNFYIK